LGYRVKQLQQLASFLTSEREGLLGALKADFKSHYEALSELRTVETEVVRAIDEISKWNRPQSLSTSLAFKLDSCTMHFEPLGTVLIIAPWNYPVDLLFSPLIGAISAGNTAILKPSEVSANTARFLDEHLSRYLDPQCFAIVTGGPSETEALLDWSHWNLIFFTGSNRVGRIVQQKAAANLIPTVLELGGKSPCIVDTNVDLTVAAKRIIFGKLFNAGQTCIAPDYILTRRELVEPLVEQLIAAIKTFYGDDPSKSFDYSQIVDQAHWDRLNSLIPATEGITRVGSSNRESRYFAPTIILEPNLGDALMREEVLDH
jgi:acyl-CoA reductase-like NAD-dependent aldehyde dehydrogenase